MCKTMCNLNRTSSSPFSLPVGDRPLCSPSISSKTPSLTPSSPSSSSSDMDLGSGASRSAAIFTIEVEAHHHSKLHWRAPPPLEGGGDHDPVGLGILIHHPATATTALHPANVTLRSFRVDRLLPELGFLQACYLCRKKLSANMDVYMHRGDRAFCSSNCRRRQISMEERSELKPSSSEVANRSPVRRRREDWRSLPVAV